MKKCVFKIVLTFILLDLICLSTFASTMLYNVSSYTFQINNISDDIKEIKFIEYEDCTVESNREYEYEIKEVPLFEEEELHVFYDGYPAIKQNNIMNYFLENEVISTEYAYQYGAYKRRV